jgi:prepilin-type N-terminal cleavage/methylation domain-containing protein
MNDKRFLNNKKKAFTLIELLIVIAIIGILFIVLVSKVDFATDKAKATGVQTDFRSFQTAFEQVARENSGYATLGWDTGDDNGDRMRNSYDKGDKECGQSGCTECKQDGVKGPHEVWVGSKTYGETWNEVFTLVNPADNKDASAFVALENAVNANLDPKLHITLTPNADASGNLTGSAVITMANQARDPWKNEYAGAYISNATVDSLDRGSIIMYSTGANGKLGTNYSVSGGLVGVEVPGSNINGKDDYLLSVTYSYANGYGEVQTGTAGFSNNQSTLTSNPIVDNGVNAGGMSAGVGSVPGENNPSDTPTEKFDMFSLAPGIYESGTLIKCWNGEITDSSSILPVVTWDEVLSSGCVIVSGDRIDINSFNWDGDLIVEENIKKVSCPFYEISSFNGLLMKSKDTASVYHNWSSPYNIFVNAEHSDVGYDQGSYAATYIGKDVSNFKLNLYYNYDCPIYVSSDNPYFVVENNVLYSTDYKVAVAGLVSTGFNERCEVISNSIYLAYGTNIPSHIKEINFQTYYFGYSAWGSNVLYFDGTMEEWLQIKNIEQYYAYCLDGTVVYGVAQS